ncbi:serine aminopeptidase domain-containing protein [Xanthobacter wiegelii]|uniref:serine aminopeptidase domain-containing protein n=1 Tax=Xanthobacter wiegelii TaxID=3119913 RepID=UPI0037363109
MRQQASCTRPGDVTAQRRGEPVRFAAPDHVVLGGFIWSHGHSDPRHPVVVISPATSVRCRYYSRFADYLYANGFNVLIYDYRGIGESRPSSLRGFQADWVDWGKRISRRPSGLRKLNSRGIRSMRSATRSAGSQSVLPPPIT